MVAVFEVGWREVAEGGMAALSVVEGLDALEDGCPGLSAGAPGLSVEQLGLEGGEEGLGDGVVPAGAGGADALAGLPIGQAGRVGVGELLGAPIGVVDQAERRSAVVQGHVEGRQRQLGAEVVGERPADHAA
jgi:hypothetical protein